MPTKAEYDALMNLEKQWVANYNNTGVAGYTFTGNGHTIFLPAAGYRGNTSVYSLGSRGNYWSSSLIEGNPNAAYLVNFSSSSASVSMDGRYPSYTVRAVQSE